MNITEIFTPKAIAMNWEEVYSNRLPYLGEGLFPAKKKRAWILVGSKATRVCQYL